jgi:pimeloyl-ACP methyl ester carboxylesterase
LTIRGVEHFPDVGGRHLDARVYGAGAPPVVLVSGFRAPQEYWNPIVPGLAEVTTVVTYDRAGYGKSERGTRPVDGLGTARDLHALLQEIRVSGPYVLVGHSYGGRIVRLFASTYPGEVAGLVLEEATHEDAMDAQREVLSGRDLETFDARTAPFRTVVPEPHTERDFMPATVTQLRASAPLPQVPFVVITSSSRRLGLPAEFSEDGQKRLVEVALELQKRLASLVPGAEHIPVEGVGHNVHLDRPEAVLVPILRLVKTVRDGAKQP